MSDSELKQLLEAQRKLDEARQVNDAFWYGALWNVRGGEGVTTGGVLPQSREERELVARRYGIKHKCNRGYQ